LPANLGYTLVEGATSHPRQPRLPSKCSAACNPSKFIFRRLDDDFCDPLELRLDSFLGGPASTHAVRSGNVAVANASAPASSKRRRCCLFAPTLPGTPRRKPVARIGATWWCGEPEGLKYALDHLDHVVLKPAFLAARMEPVFPGELTIEHRLKLANTSRSGRRDYVVSGSASNSARLPFSRRQARAAEHGAATYLAAGDQNHFTVMPALDSRQCEAGEMSSRCRRGGGSKDTWMLRRRLRRSVQLASRGRFFRWPDARRRRSPEPRRGQPLLARALRRMRRRRRPPASLHRGRQAERSGLVDRPNFPHCSNPLVRCEQHNTTKNPHDPIVEVIPAVFDVYHPVRWLECPRPSPRSIGRARDLISIDMWRVLNNLADFPTDPIATYGEEGAARRTCSTC